VYDTRKDKDFEAMDEEPPNRIFDNHMPKNAKLKAPYETVLNTTVKDGANPTHMTVQFDDQVSYSKSTTVRKKTANSTSKPKTVRAPTVEINEDSPNKKDLVIPHEQVNLPPRELKQFEIMTKE
jgi:hypothetical protein